MLLQTNSYIVPKEKRAEHARLIRRFRQTLLRLGCDHFEVYEQVGSNWSNTESAGRYVQILRFLDRKHQLSVQAAERVDPTAQAVIADFCELINFPYQQQQGLFAVGFYTSVLPITPKRGARGELISTVEHEVINDPEAEMPYDTEGSTDDTGGAESDPDDEPIVAPPGFLDEDMALGEPHLDEPPLPNVQPVESVFPPEIHPGSTEKSVHASDSVTAPAHPPADDDFMDMVSEDMDERSHGFIEADLGDDEATGAEPAQHHQSDDKPHAW